MNNIQGEALLKAYAWLGWKNSTNFDIDMVYTYHNKFIPTIRGIKNVHADIRYQLKDSLVINFHCIFERKFETDEYPFPITPETTAIETFLMATNILLQAEKKFGG